jgi:hypothetical protein
VVPRRGSPMANQRAEPAGSLPGVKPVPRVRAGRSSGWNNRAIQAGRGETEPHGREWSKHTTGFEEEQTVKVVENGEGGPKRVWKPATRCFEPGTASVVPGRERREVDSSSWERRRGEELQGRMDGQTGRRSSEDLLYGPRSGRDPRGRTKGQERYSLGRETNRGATRRKTPGSRSQDRKGEGGSAKPDERIRRVVKR